MGTLSNKYPNSQAVETALNKGVEALTATTELKEDLSEISDRLTAVDGIVSVELENGNITMHETYLTYSNSSTRLRTPENGGIPVEAGDVVRLSSYSNATFYVAVNDSEGHYITNGWRTSDYIIPKNGIVHLLCRYNPESVINVGDLEFQVIKSKSAINEVSKNSENVNQIMSAVFSEANIPTEFGSIDTSVGSDYDSSTALRTIGFLDDSIMSVEFNRNYKAFIYAYDKSGAYIGRYTGNDFNKDYAQSKKVESPINLRSISDNDYIYRLVFVDNQTPSVDNIDLIANVNNIKLVPKEEKIYTVGQGKQFTTFTEMLTALSNNTDNKTVYVYNGEYDIFEEIGGSEYADSLVGTDWRSANKIIPPNTKIIGLGNVKFVFNLPDDTTEVARNLLSALNISGSCEITNINIECKNCRYALHVEGSAYSQYDNATITLDNVNIKRVQGVYARQVLGCGLNRGCTLIVKNCKWENTESNCFYVHTNSTDKLPIIKIENSQMITNGTAPIYLDSQNNTYTTGKVAVKMNGVYTTNGKIMKANITNGDAFHVVASCCNQIVQTTFNEGYDMDNAEEYLVIN